MRPESAQAILEIAPNAFVSLDAEGRVQEWNHRATELFGYTRAEALGTELAELIVPPRHRARHRAGIRAAAGQTPLTRRLIVEALCRDGREIPVEVSITAVAQADAPVFHAWIHDVSERPQLLARLEGQQRGREPGFGQILDALAEAVTIRDPHHHILYANRAALDHMGFASLEDMQRQPPQSIMDYVVHDEHGVELSMEAIPSVRLLAGESAQPLVMRTINRATGQLRWQLLKSVLIDDEDGRPVVAVTIIEDITRERIAELRDRFMARASETLMSSLGTSELYQDIPDETLVRAAVDQEHLELLRSLGLRSVALVPLVAHGRALGVMTLVNAESMRRFDDDDREFAEQVAARAAIAVDNARLSTARPETANTLQKSLLPDVVPRIDGWSVATLYRAARPAEEVEVGGDFYDFYESDGWIVLLGDVTGKGVGAAALTALVRHGARFLSRYERNPSRILSGLNEALREQPGLRLCTAVCARLDEEQVVIASAGHPPVLVVRDDGRLREIGAAGPILGAWANQGSVDWAVPVGADETLFIYTDGVIDTLGEHERFGVGRLKRWLCDHARQPPEALLRGLEAELDRFQVGAPADDTAALALRPAAPAGALAARERHPADGVRTLPVA